MNGASPCRNWHNPRVVKRVLLHARNFFTWSESCFTTPFDPNVLSRQTKPHCGLRQFWGQFCLMLFLNFKCVPNGLKKWSIQPNRFLRWIESQLNLFWSLPGEKRARFDQGSRNCLQKNRPATWRNFDVVLVCQTTDHHHNSGGFWNDEARRKSSDYVHFARPGNR